MYKLSFEKCVCFIFLIILALLSCSGFRIDRLTTMSDINKRNSFTSNSLSSKSSDLISRLFVNNNNFTRHGRNISDLDYYLSSTQNNFPETRHLKRRKNQSRRSRITRAQALRVESREQPKPNRHPTGRINTIVIPPKNELTAAPISRLQRSPNKVKPLHPRNNNKAYHCQRQDVARKAYLSNTVVRAKAESMSSNRIHNYSVTFRILERYKTFLPVDDTLRLTFSSDTKDMNCEIDGHKRPTAHDLVKAQIQQSKEYFLFLNSHGMHNYSVVGMPVLKKKRHNNNNNNNNNTNKKNKDLEDIKRITNKNFVLKSPKKPKLRSNRMEDLKPGKKLRLVCNVKGFPVPNVSWSKNGKDGLHSSKRMRITYKKKRTTLLINSVQMEDEGVYQCISKGVDGSIMQDEIRVRISNSEQDNGNECKDDEFKKNFCLNGGTCVRIMHKEIGCQCRDGFTGERCEKKDVSNHSSMYGQNTFSCKLGLSTTYYC